MGASPSSCAWDWTIGRVVAPFGIRGEMKTEILTDFPERFEELQEVALVSGSGETRVLNVQGARLHKGRVLLKLRGIETLEDVEAWRGAEVRVPRSAAVPLAPGDYYVSDLVGMEIVTRDGRRVGPVEDILQSPAHDLLRTGEVLIPMVRAIVLEIDIEARRIVVDPPLGLLPGDESGSSEEV